MNLLLIGYCSSKIIPQLIYKIIIKRIYKSTNRLEKIQDLISNYKKKNKMINRFKIQKMWLKILNKENTRKWIYLNLLLVKQNF